MVYARIGAPGLFSLPLEGGTPRLISEASPMTLPSISPDGRRLLFEGSETGIIVCNLPDCSNVMKLSLERALATGITWAPDGSGVAYVPVHDPANVWTRPIDGGAPRRLTRFEDKRIFEFGFSADYKRLAVCRGERTTDVVLIKGLQ
jgi:Tol biopolymer transport system component